MDHAGDVVENQCSCPVSSARCKHVVALMNHILEEFDSAVNDDTDDDTDAADQAKGPGSRPAPAVPVADRPEFELKPLPQTAKGKRKLPGYLGQNNGTTVPTAKRPAVAAAVGSKLTSRGKKKVAAGNPKRNGKAPLKVVATSRSGGHAPAATASARYKVSATDLIAYARDILSRKESDNPGDPVGVPRAVRAPAEVPRARGSAAAAPAAVAASARASSDSDEFDDAETQLQDETGNGNGDDGMDDEYGGETEVLADEYGGETEAAPEIDGAFDAETQEMVSELGAVSEEDEASEQPIPSRVAVPTPVAEPLAKKNKKPQLSDLW